MRVAIATGARERGQAGPLALRWRWAAPAVDGGSVAVRMARLRLGPVRRCGAGWRFAVRTRREGLRSEHRLGELEQGGGGA